MCIHFYRLFRPLVVNRDICRLLLVSTYWEVLLVPSWLLGIGVSRASLMVGGSLVPRRSLPGQSWTLPWAAASPRETRRSLFPRLRADNEATENAWALGWVSGFRSEALGWFSNRTGTSVRQMTTGKRAERTKHDFRCSICPSAIGQASCLICARRRRLTFPFCC